MQKILVVEDDMLIAHYLKKMLSVIGYSNIETCAYGEDAIESVRAERPGLVLMDIMLRGELDGIEAARQIMQEHDDIPLIFLTGNTDNATYERAMKTSPRGVLQKPLGKGQLQDAVEGIFGPAVEG